MVVIAALRWRDRLVLSEAEVAATATTATTVTTRCDATDQEQRLKLKVMKTLSMIHIKILTLHVGDVTTK